MNLDEQLHESLDAVIMAATMFWANDTRNQVLMRHLVVVNGILERLKERYNAKKQAH